MDNHKLSEDFLQKITNFSAGFLPPGVLESFISLLEKEIKNHFFTFSSESNLLRIISAMYDKRAFISDTIHYPHYAEILISIAVNSNYLTDILVRNPEYFYRIVNPSHLNRPFTYEECRKIAADTVSSYKTFSAKINALRNLKRREILRIGLKDILRISEVQNITLELSILAKELSAYLFDICYEEILSRNNLANVKNRFCIISLGKLGGRELNYSSDIDLMIFYDKDSSYNKKTYREILTEAVFLFIEQASSITGSGYLYRVDFRLRPDGRNAPLCDTITDYINYYESRGEDWERQMLIKSDHLAGDPALFEKFTEYLQPFIYPSSFKSSPVDQIRKLKLSIENALKDEQNIKLAWGGIRDIEFTVQALQLLNGFRSKSLRTGNTLEALNALASAKLLTAGEYEILSETYKTYRRIEHYLQLMNDRQTHSIPRSGEMLSRIAAFLGYKNEKEFRLDISYKRKEIKQIFETLSGPADKKNEKPLEINFSNPSKAEKDILYLREGKGLLGTREFDMQSINAFVRIEPELVKYLSGSINADLVLQNFVRIIRTSAFPSVWYNSFQNKKTFNAFLTICGYSQKSVDLFAEDNQLQELFLSGAVFKKPEEINRLTIRELHFILSVQLCLKIIDPLKFSSLLSKYFSERIKELAVGYLGKESFFIAGMGSFGTKEMSFASDIDLIYVVEKISSSKDQQRTFLKFLQKLKDEFKPVETDCRLRPEGKSSQLVWDINSYTNYINTRARVWEFQALTRLNFIAGDKDIFNKFLKAVKGKMKTLDCKVVRKEMTEMRRKQYPAEYSGIAKIYNIKRAAGGLTDIEFIIQYLILCTPELFLKCRGKMTTSALRLLEEKIPETDLSALEENYNFLRTADLINQNMFNVNNHNIDRHSPSLSAFLGYASENDFSSLFQKTTHSVHKLFIKYLGNN